MKGTSFNFAYTHIIKIVYSCMLIDRPLHCMFDRMRSVAISGFDESHNKYPFSSVSTSPQRKTLLIINNFCH